MRWSCAWECPGINYGFLVLMYATDETDSAVNRVQKKAILHACVSQRPSTATSARRHGGAARPRRRVDASHLLRRGCATRITIARRLSRRRMRSMPAAPPRRALNPRPTPPPFALVSMNSLFTQPRSVQTWSGDRVFGTVTPSGHRHTTRNRSVRSHAARDCGAPRTSISTNSLRLHYAAS